MITGNTRASRITLLASIPVLALVTFAAGCGTATIPPTAGRTGSAQPSTGKSASASSTPASGTPASGTPASGTPTAVPTTTSGPPVRAGQPACTGWPANAPNGTLPAYFVPVAVLRCLAGYQTIPGKGQWQTATLQRADKDLAALIAALRLPQEVRAPGIMCPQLAMLPPQIVLVSADGKTLVPRLPLSGCGLIQEQVLAALAGLPWQTMSVRLVKLIQPPAEFASG